MPEAAPSVEAVQVSAGWRRVGVPTITAVGTVGFVWSKMMVRAAEATDSLPALSTARTVYA